MAANESVQLLSAADASVTQTSVPMQISGQLYYGVQVMFSSGTLGGAVKLVGSIDGTNYGDIQGSSQAVVAGAGVIYSATAAGYLWVKAVWTPTGGTGTVTVLGCVKEPTNKY